MKMETDGFNVEDMTRLTCVLESVGFPLLSYVRLNYKTTLQISVTDFLRICACIGNNISATLHRKYMFPKVYSGFRLFSKDRDGCCEGIAVLALKMGFCKNYRKIDIISDGPRYAKRRATFLLWLCMYWQQIFSRTPPRSNTGQTGVGATTSDIRTPVTLSRNSPPLLAQKE